MKAFEISSVSYRYPSSSKNALNEISLSCDEGEFLVLMGESGAGKSTLCMLLNNLIPNFTKGEFSGSVKLFGEDISLRKTFELAKIVGIVFQDFETQLFSTNVELEVAFLPLNLGIERDEVKNRVLSSLAYVGLSGFERRNPGTLSGGEKQRLAVASVFSGLPYVLVMDEPTSDLDPIGAEEVHSIAKKLTGEGRTILFVEHDVRSLSFADRIIIMSDGRIVKDEKSEEVLREPMKFYEFGIRPPEIPFLFSGIRVKGPELPISLDSAVSFMRNNSISISQNLYNEILEKERVRNEKYGETILETCGLSFKYDKKYAIEDVSLSIREGEFVAIVGQNGSGKSTLVKHFNGLLFQEKGRVVVMGKDTREIPISELARTVGYVFQNPDHQIFARSCIEEVLFGPLNLGVPLLTAKSMCYSALSEVDLAGYEERDPFTLTKSERQRLAVASVLASAPKILIFDEPTTGLDYNQTKRMMELIKRLNEKGRTIIMITHTMWVVAEYAHRTIVMKDGRIVLDGNTREIFSKVEELKETRLLPPETALLSLNFGMIFLYPEEMRKCIGW